MRRASSASCARRPRSPRCSATRSISTSGSRRRPGSPPAGKRRAACGSPATRTAGPSSSARRRRRGASAWTCICCRPPRRRRCGRCWRSTISSARPSCRPTGRPSPSDIAQSLAKGARMHGAKLFEGVGCTGFEIEDGRVDGGRAPTAGTIACDKVVLCAGMWSRQIGALAGVSVPLQPVKHQYVITEKIDGIAPGMATIRDPDRRTYFKEEVGGLVFGGYEPDPIAWTRRSCRSDFEFQLFDDDWDHFEQHMTAAMARIPALEKTGIKQMINGPGDVHARRQFHPRRGAGGAELLRRRRLQRLRHRLGRRRGLGARRLGDEAASADGPLGRRHPPLLRAPPRPRLDARAHARGLRQALHHRLPARGIRERPAAHRLAALRAAEGAPRRASARSSAGSGPTGSRRPGDEPRDIYSIGRGNWFDAVGEEHRGGARGGGALRPVVLRQVRDDAARTPTQALSWIGANDVDHGRRAGSPIRRCSTRAAASSAT